MAALQAGSPLPPGSLDPPLELLCASLAGRAPRRRRLPSSTSSVLHLSCPGIDVTRMKSAGVPGSSLWGDPRWPQGRKARLLLLFPHCPLFELPQSLRFSDPSPGLFQDRLPKSLAIPPLPTNLSASACQAARRLLSSAFHPAALSHNLSGG